MYIVYTVHVHVCQTAHYTIEPTQPLPLPPLSSFPFFFLLSPLLLLSPLSSPLPVSLVLQRTYVSLARAAADVASPVMTMLSNRIPLPTVHNSNPRAEMGVSLEKTEPSSSKYAGLGILRGFHIPYVQ